MLKNFAIFSISDALISLFKSCIMLYYFVTAPDPTQSSLLPAGWTGIMRDHLRRIIPHTTWYFKRSAFSHPDTRKRAAPLFKVRTTEL